MYIDTVQVSMIGIYCDTAAKPLTLPRSLIRWYSLVWLSRTTIERVLEERVSSPLKMKLRSPLDQRISVKSPSVESRRIQQSVLYIRQTSDGSRRDKRGTGGREGGREGGRGGGGEG